MSDPKQRSSLLGDVSAVITILLFLFSVVSAVGAYLLKAPVAALILLAIGGCLVLFFLGRRYRQTIGIWLLALANRLAYFKDDWELTDKVAEYTYLDRETMTFEVRYKVKFLSGSHKKIMDRLKWTVGDVDRIVNVEPKQRIVPIPEEQRDDIQAQLGYQNFVIHLSDGSKRYTNQDPPIPSGYRCEGLHDPDHKAMTCLIMGISRKTDRMVMRVRFHNTLRVSNIRKLAYADYLDTVPLSREDGELRTDGEFNYVEFSVEQPILGGKYAIDWDFSD